MKAEGVFRDAKGRETQSSGRIRRRAILRKVVFVCEKLTFMKKLVLKYFCHRNVSHFFFRLIQNYQKNNSTQFFFNFLQYLISLLGHSIDIVEEKRNFPHFLTHVIFFARMSLLLFLLFRDKYSWAEKGYRIVFLLYCEVSHRTNLQSLLSYVVDSLLAKNRWGVL